MFYIFYILCLQLITLQTFLEQGQGTFFGFQLAWKFFVDGGAQVLVGLECVYVDTHDNYCVLLYLLNLGGVPCPPTSLAPTARLIFCAFVGFQRNRKGSEVLLCLTP